MASKVFNIMIMGKTLIAVGFSQRLMQPQFVEGFSPIKYVGLKSMLMWKLLTVG
jgi:hypothetical protein